MLNYAQVRQETYYAQIYASIMCQGLSFIMWRDFEGSVYWDKFAEACGEISRKYGICMSKCLVNVMVLKWTLCIQCGVHWHIQEFP